MTLLSRQKNILILAILLSLTACGFHLYGKKAVPPQMQTMYLQSNTPYGTLETNLKQSLLAVGVKFADAADQAPVTLNITSTNLSHADSNTVSSAQATVYNFTYDVTFNLLDASGNPIIDSQTVKATRTLTLNPNEVLDANPEVDTMQQEMERELSFKIIQILGSPNTRQALTKLKKSHETAPRTVSTKSKK
jgi:LPS-assembly lipoprotein